MEFRLPLPHDVFSATPDYGPTHEPDRDIDMDEEQWDNDWSESALPETHVETLYRLWAIRGEFG
jgi:hypothetical protein